MKKGDFKLHNYQDDLDTDQDQTDPLATETTEDLTRELNIPAEEMKDELDKLDPDTDEDARERVEDIDDEKGGENNQ